jgi:NADH:ubiquinone oxidoreductase subunit F (NADH-binding)
VSAVLEAPTGIARLLAGAEPGPRPSLDRATLLRELELSGLTGRGGAGFPIARKLAAAGPAPVVIGNGSEGEPLSRKDVTLLTRAPQLMLDGLLVIAEALGASETHLVVNPAAEAHAAAAIAARPDAAGIRLRVAADAFVGGEASAVVNALARGRTTPRDHPVRLTTSGLGGRPTIVQNVETLAHAGLVARFGGAWFRSVGAADDPGTRLVTVTGDVAQPLVLEIPGGASLGSVLAAAGVDPAGVRAVLVGGYHGAWTTDLSAPLAPGAIPPGAGVLRVLASGRCGISAAAPIAAYLAQQSARQCGPCVNGLPRMATVLERIARGDRDPALAHEAARLAALVTGRGACHHPDGTARMVLSTLDVFAADVAAHVRGTCLEEAR